jgi:hypothetical protein
MSIKSVIRMLAVFIIGALVGVLYYSLSWRYHLPYIGFNWLGPLIGADGEKGYDAMLYESMIDFGILVALVSVLVRFAYSRRRRKDESLP